MPTHSRVFPPLRKSYISSLFPLFASNFLLNPMQGVFSPHCFTDITLIKAAKPSASLTSRQHFTSVYFLKQSSFMTLRFPLPSPSLSVSLAGISSTRALNVVTPPGFWLWLFSDINILFLVHLLRYFGFKQCKQILTTQFCISSFYPTTYLTPLYGTLRASLVAQPVKSLPAVQETRVQSLGQEDLLEKGMATHSSILAWRIPWAEEPGGLQSMTRLTYGCLKTISPKTWPKWCLIPQTTSS